MTTMTTLRSTISPFLIVQALLLLLLFLPSGAFANAETAFVSTFLILLGSMYGYGKMVDRAVQNEASPLQKNVLEAIDDPYDLYDEEASDEMQERPLKEVIKEEKARLKANKATMKKVSKSAPAMFSLYRLVPYGILVLGFIALNNNGMLNLWYFLPGLAGGIVAGYFSGRALFTGAYKP